MKVITEVQSDSKELEKMAAEMVEAAGKFLASPLARTMQMEQANIDAISAEFKAMNLWPSEETYRLAFLSARDKGLLKMVPVAPVYRISPEDQARLDAAKQKEADELAERERKERAEEQRNEYRRRDEQPGSRMSNVHEESPVDFQLRAAKEAIELTKRTDRNIKTLINSKKQEAERAANSEFAGLPSVAQIVRSGGTHMPLDQFKQLTLQQAKEYRKRYNAAEDQLKTTRKRTWQ